MFHVKSLNRFDSSRNSPISSAVKTPLSERKVWGSNSGSVKWDTVSQTASHHCDVSSKRRCPSAKPGRWPCYTLQRNNESVTNV